MGQRLLCRPGSLMPGKARAAYFRKLFYLVNPLCEK